MPYFDVYKTLWRQNFQKQGPLLVFFSPGRHVTSVLIILYFVLYRNNQIYKKGQSQRLKWLGQHNNNRGLLKEQTGLTNRREPWERGCLRLSFEDCGEVFAKTSVIHNSIFKFFLVSVLNLNKLIVQHRFENVQN